MAEVPPTATATPTSPESVGKYELLARLGSGRNCDVFLAVRRGAERRRIVALKRLRERLTHREGASAALLREAELASQIKHAKVVDIYEYGDADGACYIAMEYLAGQPLGALIRRAGGLPEACVARIGADVADGLAAAHRLTDDDGKPLGLVHFDVSPSNVQVLYDGRVLLVDFGLARALSAEPGTRGKIGYLAPEQITGPRDAPDARTDLFALGVVLWEAATGKRLFREEDREATLKAITDGDAPLVTSVRSDFDAGLSAIIAKALARDPDERYKTGRDLAAALRGYLADSDAIDTTGEISTLMLEHFVAEREMADLAVANAMAVLAGERSGPTAKRAPTVDDPEPEVPDVSAAAASGEESDYYYYEDEVPAPLAGAPAPDAETETETARDAAIETDADEGPAVAVAASAAIEPERPRPEPAKPLDLDDDDDLDADIIGGRSRVWMVGAAAAALLLVVILVLVFSRGDDKKNAAAPTDDDSTTGDRKSPPGTAVSPSASAELGKSVEPAAGSADEAESADQTAAARAAEDAAAARAAEDAAAARAAEDAAAARAAEDAAAQAAEDAAAAQAAAAAATRDAEEAAATAARDAAATAARDAAAAKAAAKAADSASAKARRAEIKKARAEARAAKREARAKRKAEAAARRKARAEAKAAAAASAPEPKRDKAAAKAAYQAASRSLVTGDAAGAIQKYREALAAWPGYSPAYRGLGLANERRGNNKSAVRFYKRYLRSSPRAKDADSIRARINRLGG